MINRTITDKDRLGEFDVASRGYLMAFDLKGEGRYSPEAEEKIKAKFFNSIAYLTLEQKKQSKKELREILKNGVCNEGAYKDLVFRALASSETMECLRFGGEIKIVDDGYSNNKENVDSALKGLNLCIPMPVCFNDTLTEEAIDYEFAKVNPELIIYRDSDTGERRLYRERN